MEPEEKKEPKKLNKRFLLVLIVILIVGGGFGIYKYSYSKNHETTDNAQVVADITPVIPHVSGYIKKVYVTDNQFVKKGDTLLVIDNTEFALRVAEAEATVAIAQGNLGVSKENVGLSHAQVATANASVTSAGTSIESAKIRVWKANQDFNRYANLLKENAATQRQFETAKAEKETAEKQLELVERQKEIASSQKGSQVSQEKVIESQISVSKSKIDQSMAQLNVAKLNLSYCVVLAQEDGQVSSVKIVDGQLISAGQPLFNIVLLNNLWVNANFKETQIGKMKEGQPVNVEIDAFPGVEIKGTISSISPGTGSIFTLLPPDNATGNFVKIVQRVAVKIELSKEDSEAIRKLRPGLSAEVTVTLKS